MTTRDLIQQAFDQGKLRHPPDKLDFTQVELSLELQRTPWTGTEFGYAPATDEITYAWRSVDGADIDPEEFLTELGEAVGVKVDGWKVGDVAWLTVPSRDSAGYSKRNIGSLTIPVKVTAVTNKSVVEIQPVGGSGRAGVKTERLKPRKGPDPATVFDVIGDVLHSVSLAMQTEGISDRVTREVMETVNDYVINHYGED